MTDVILNSAFISGIHKIYKTQIKKRKDRQNKQTKAAILASTLSISKIEVSLRN